MDPRHPEKAISRMVDLMTQFNLILTDMKHTTVSAQLGQLEREGGLVVQEICLVAPRLHEAMMQVSRQRRHELSRGILLGPQDTAVETPQGGMFESEIVEEPVEKPVEIVTDIENPYDKIAVHDAKPEEYIEKPKKKTTRKKKTAKKAK